MGFNSSDNTYKMIFFIYFIYLLVFYLFIILINSILIKIKIDKKNFKNWIKKMKLTLITNLFEIFDPSTRNNLSINWLFLTLPIIIFPRIFWLIQSRIIFIINPILRMRIFISNWTIIFERKRIIEWKCYNFNFL